MCCPSSSLSHLLIKSISLKDVVVVTMMQRIQRRVLAVRNCFGLLHRMTTSKATAISSGILDQKLNQAVVEVPISSLVEIEDDEVIHMRVHLR